MVPSSPTRKSGETNVTEDLNSETALRAMFVVAANEPAGLPAVVATVSDDVGANDQISGDDGNDLLVGGALEGRPICCGKVSLPGGHVDSQEAGGLSGA